MISSLSETLTELNKCAHCGLEFRYEIGKTPSSEYCCWGCKTVFELLTQSGLKQFYNIKAEGVCFAKPLSGLSGPTSFAHWEGPQREVQIYVGGVHCSACLWLLERIPQVLNSDVSSARLDISKSLLHIELLPEGRAANVGNLIRSWGYRPQLVSEPQEVRELQAKETQSQLLELGIAGAIAGNIMLMSLGVYAGATGTVATLFNWISGVLALPVVFY